MTFIALALSFFVAVLGALGVASPARLIGVVRAFQTPTGLYLAAAIRLVFGAALFVAAPESRAPEPIRGLGIFVFVAGLITPLFGLARYRRLLDWWAGRGPVFIRIWAAFALAFGLSLAYALVPGVLATSGR